MASFSSPKPGKFRYDPPLEKGCIAAAVRRLLGPDPAHCTTQLPERDTGHERGARFRGLDHRVDGLVAQVVDVGRFPVVEAALREERIERGLQGRVRDWSAEVHQRGGELPQWLHDPLALVD